MVKTQLNTNNTVTDIKILYRSVEYGKQYDFPTSLTLFHMTDSDLTQEMLLIILIHVMVKVEKIIHKIYNNQDMDMIIILILNHTLRNYSHIFNIRRLMVLIYLIYLIYLNIL